MTAAALLPASAALADAGVSVRAGGATTFVSAADLAAQDDLDRGTVTVRLAGGQVQSFERPPALSLNGLLVAAGVNPATVGYVAIARPNGSLIQIRGTDLDAAAASPDGPPAFWVDADATHFLRTARDDTDVNATDSVASVSGQPLTVDVHAGLPIAVTANATPTTATTGAPVTLTASTDAADPASLTYTWDLGDGATATGATVTHAYAAAGRYVPAVTVAGPDDSGGAATTAAVTIGAAPTPPAGTGTSPTTGSKSTGGGTRDPHDAAATGTTKQTKQTKTTTTSAAPQQPASTPAPTAPSPGAPAAPAASAAPTPAAAATAPKTKTKTTTKKRRAKRASATPTPTPPRKTPSTSTTSATRVTGVLIAGADAAAISAGLSAAANPGAAAGALLPGARAGDGAAPGSAFPTRTLLAIGAVLVLIALGATREVRRR